MPGLFETALVFGTSSCASSAKYQVESGASPKTNRVSAAPPACGSGSAIQRSRSAAAPKFPAVIGSCDTLMVGSKAAYSGASSVSMATPWPRSNRLMIACLSTA